MHYPSTEIGESMFPTIESLAAWLDDAYGEARNSEPKCYKVGVAVPFPLWSSVSRLPELLSHLTVIIKVNALEPHVTVTSGKSK